jgi:basic membrane protein A
MLGTTASLGIAGCLGEDDDPTTEVQTTTAGTDTLRAAFVYHDIIGDLGWQWAHDQGRRAVESEFDWVETTIFQEHDPEGSAPRFAQYAKRGFDIIFATSFDYMDPVASVAPDYPDVIFEHCSGYKQGENLGRYFGRMYEPRYLTGLAAGMVTEAEEIGFVAAFDIPEVIRGINAFALGVAAANPAATVQVTYTGSWNNADAETDATSALLDLGVDVMAQHLNYPTVAQKAADEGIWAIGYNSPMGDLVGENYVTSPIWDWEVYYKQAVEEVYNDSWESDFYWKGLESGIVGLSEWGPKVPESVISEVDAQRQQLINKERDIWAGTPFAEYTERELFREMNQYVDNVTVRTEPGG